MAVYRRPYDFASHRARVIWQPINDWAFQGFNANVDYTTYAGQITLYPTITCTADTVVYTTHKATLGNITIIGVADAVVYTENQASIGSFVLIVGYPDLVTYTGQTGAISGLLLHVPAQNMSIRTTQGSMSARASGNRITLRAA